MGRQRSERMGTWWLPRVDRAQVLLRTLSGRMLSLGGSDGVDSGARRTCEGDQHFSKA
jgi:hypothetical protein